MFRVIRAVPVPFLLTLYAAASNAQTLSFRNGVDGYAGTLDTDMSQNQANTVRQNSSFNDVAFVDAADTGQNNAFHSLLRFDNIFGNGAGQIPIGSAIISATLRIETGSAARFSDGQGGTFHRMLTTWTEAATWNSVGNGIQADNSEALSAITTQVGDGSSIIPADQVFSLDVRQDVQAWSNGSANFGWAMLPYANGTNGWGFVTRDSSVVSSRPLLTINYAPVPAPSALAAFVIGAVPGVVLVRHRHKA